jgi:hypothetical protein
MFSQCVCGGKAFCYQAGVDVGMYVAMCWVLLCWWLCCWDVVKTTNIDALMIVLLCGCDVSMCWRLCYCDVLMSWCVTRWLVSRCLGWIVRVLSIFAGKELTNGTREVEAHVLSKVARSFCNPRTSYVGFWVWWCKWIEVMNFTLSAISHQEI